MLLYHPTSRFNPSPPRPSNWLLQPQASSTTDDNRAKQPTHIYALTISSDIFRGVGMDPASLFDSLSLREPSPQVKSSDSVIPSWVSRDVLNYRFSSWEVSKEKQDCVIVRGIERETNRKLSCKIASSSATSASRRLKHEYDAMTACNHKYILGPAAIFEDNEQISLFHEYMNYDLFDLVGSLRPDTAFNLCRRLVEGMCYLHSNNICHLDLKCESVYIKVPEGLNLCALHDPAQVDRFDLKIGGFTTWTRIRDQNGKQRRLQGCCSSPGYDAPEVHTRGYDGAAADMWSLGRILFQAMVGFPSWEVADTTDPFYNVWLLGDLYTYWDAIVSHSEWKVSEAFMHLIKGLLDPNPKRRFTAEQALAHPFFTGERFTWTPPKCAWEVESTTNCAAP